MGQPSRAASQPLWARPRGVACESAADYGVRAVAERG